MQASADISYYPLTEEYLTPIKAFIARLNTYSEILVKTNGMSTQVFGEYRDLMRILTDEIEIAMQTPHSLFMIKLANAKLDSYSGS